MPQSENPLRRKQNAQSGAVIAEDRMQTGITIANFDSKQVGTGAVAAGRPPYPPAVAALADQAAREQ